MNRKHIYIALFFLAALLPFRASAQSVASEATRNFVQEAAIINLFELRSSELALEEARRPDVRDFAQHLVEDHAAVGSNLRAALDAANIITPVPQELDHAHTEIMGSLRRAGAANFDARYVRAQVDAHEQAVIVFQDYATNGDEPALRAFASEALPGLRQHLQSARRLGQVAVR